MADLTTRLKNSKQEALKTIYEQYYEIVLSFSIRMLKDPIIAKDVTQSTFLKLWDQRHNLSMQLDLEFQLFRIAKNLIIDDYRKQKLHQKFIDSVISEDVTADEINFSIPYSDLRQALDQLPQKRKQAIILSKVNGLTHYEIAEKLGVSPRTIETNIRLAKIALKKLLLKGAKIFL